MYHLGADTEHTKAGRNMRWAESAGKCLGGADFEHASTSQCSRCRFSSVGQFGSGAWGFLLGFWCFILGVEFFTPPGLHQGISMFLPNPGFSDPILFDIDKYPLIRYLYS